MNIFEIRPEIVEACVLIDNLSCQGKPSARWSGMRIIFLLNTWWTFWNARISTWDVCKSTSSRNFFFSTKKKVDDLRSLLFFFFFLINCLLALWNQCADERSIFKTKKLVHNLKKKKSVSGGIKIAFFTSPCSSEK